MKQKESKGGGSINLIYAGGKESNIEVAAEEELFISIEKLDEAVDDLMTLPFWKILKRKRLLERIEYISEHIKNLF